jgi:hypothetical protein
LSTILKPKQSQAGIARAILRFVDRTQDLAFGPARSYILKGLADGIRDQIVFDFSMAFPSVFCFILCRLGEFSDALGSGKMKTELSLTICLHLLLSVDVDAVGFDEYFR